MARISFNAWLTLQKDGPHAAVAAAWQTTRGRLTRDTVVKRAGEAGGLAYDAYLAAVPPPPAAPLCDDMPGNY